MRGNQQIVQADVLLLKLRETGFIMIDRAASGRSYIYAPRFDAY